MIQPPHNPGKIRIAPHIKITALGQILAEQPVGILVQYPLPCHAHSGKDGGNASADANSRPSPLDRRRVAFIFWPEKKHELTPIASLQPEKLYFKVLSVLKRLLR